MRAYLSSATANIPSSANLAGISSPVVDTLISHVLSARGSEQLIAAGRPQPRAVYWDKFGQPDIEAETITSFPHTWWWDEVRAARIRLKNQVFSKGPRRSSSRTGLRLGTSSRTRA